MARAPSALRPLHAACCMYRSLHRSRVCDLCVVYYTDASIDMNSFIYTYINGHNVKLHHIVAEFNSATLAIRWCFHAHLFFGSGLLTAELVLICWSRASIAKCAAYLIIVVKTNYVLHTINVRYTDLLRMFEDRIWWHTLHNRRMSPTSRIILPVGTLHLPKLFTKRVHMALKSVSSMKWNECNCRNKIMFITCRNG
jgi:hypothetical protein